MQKFKTIQFSQKEIIKYWKKRSEIRIINNLTKWALDFLSSATYFFQHAKYSSITCLNLSRICRFPFLVGFKNFIGKKGKRERAQNLGFLGNKDVLMHTIFLLFFLDFMMERSLPDQEITHTIFSIFLWYFNLIFIHVMYIIISYYM